MSGHEPARERLGSLALGVLEPAEAEAVRRHAASCPACGPELAELQSTARLLALADPDHVEAAARAPAPPSLAPVLDRIDAERRAGRARRRARLAGGLVAAAALLGVLLVVALGEPGPREVTLASRLPGVTATARLAPSDPGTRIELAVDGLAPAQTLLAWLERPDGRRVPAGPVRAGADRTLRATLQARLPTRDAAAVGLSQPDGTDVLRAELD